MKINEEKVSEVLIKGNYVTESDLREAKELAGKNHTSLVECLIAKNIINRDLLGQAIAEFFSILYADLNSIQPEKEQVLLIPETIAKRFHVVVFKKDEEAIVIATDNPAQRGLKENLATVFPGKEIKIALSFTEDIEPLFIYYQKSLDTRFSRIIEGNKKVAPEIIDAIIEDAISFRSSDIHFEPQEKEVVVRFRIDGLLQEAGRIPKIFYENVLNRVKVQSHLRTDEHFSAQDGAIRFGKDNREVDLRVSIVPTVDGEKIVMRLLGEYVKNLALSDLGLSENDQQVIEEESKKPFGMILVTGPTGSGKSTTLYGVLKSINTTQVNITTIEDPVEYKIPGVNHIQVNLQTNMTFAKGLKSIVRQDPDIILVGEIRDRETSEVAVNAALTGHLLFSTFHANDAPTAIPRLLDMGVEPFLLSSTLNLIIAQRLTRRICDHCRISYAVNKAELEKNYPQLKGFIGSDAKTFYRGKGCEICNFTGYKGRIGIFELVRITPEMKELVLRHPSTIEIWDLARRQGSMALFEDGIEKVKKGTTTIEELLRVAEPPQFKV